ncbi:hypothetical protein PIB30_064798, partial [Stylosanthes scabra]|nr:hypothetical protein [Stylosanthes scabra]
MDFVLKKKGPLARPLAGRGDILSPQEFGGLARPAPFLGGLWRGGSGARIATP